MPTPKQIIDEQKRLETVRKPYEKLKELSTCLSYPEREDQMSYYAKFDEQASSRARKNTRKVYDPTANKGLDIWGTGLMGYYMPKEINWFTEQMSNRAIRDEKVVKRWLQEVDEHMRFTLDRSNYYEQKLVTLKDAGAIGDSFMFIDSDEDTGKQIMMAPHPRELYIRRDFWGRVVCIHHKFVKTIREISVEFGDRGLTQAEKDNLKETPNQKIEVIHGIYKNKDYTPDKPGVKNMKWQHYYVNHDAELAIHHTGSNTLNPIPWSLARPSHEDYGRGLVSQLLIEILTANFISRDVLNASSLAARPPILVTSALKHKLRLQGGAANFVNSQEMLGLKMGDLVTRLTDSSGYPFGIEQQQAWQNMIDIRFGVPLFQAWNNATEKTAFEIRTRQGERAVLMAPFLGTLGRTTDLELDRVFDIELQAGRIPEIPQQVKDAADGRIDIQYSGPLVQLLKQFYETGNVMNTIANMQAVMSVKPEAAVVVSGEELMRKILESSNAPEEIILTRDEVAEINAIAAENEEQMRTNDLAAQTAGMVPNLSKKIESDSVLSKLTGKAA